MNPRGTLAGRDCGRDAYCRRARRLRHHFAADPVRRHAALQMLARQHDQAAHDAPIAPADAASRCTFAEAVADRFTGPTLCYSDRLELLRHAAALGIRPFEASLIIATVQHRHQHAAAPRGWPRMLAPAATFLLVQGSIIGLACWLFSQ